MTTATSDAPKVRLEAMTRRYGDVVAASDVTFDVRPGEMFGLIGPDGAGKTTTLRVVLGLLGPRLRERPHLRPRARAGRATRSRGGSATSPSASPSTATSRWTRTCRSSPRSTASAAGRARRDELLDMLRMTPFRDRLAERLSGGMKQKLALACTLIHTPELLVLDEPTTGVDPVSRRDFWKHPGPPPARRAHAPADDALPRRGRALPARGPDGPRPHPQPEHPRGAPGERHGRGRRDRGRAEAPGRRAARGDAGSGRRGGLRRAAPRHSPRRSPGTTGPPPGSRLARALSAAGVAVQHVRTTAPSLEDLFIARIRAAEAAAPGEVTR